MGAWGLEFSTLKPLFRSPPNQAPKSRIKAAHFGGYSLCFASRCGACLIGLHLPIPAAFPDQRHGESGPWFTRLGWQPYSGSNAGGSGLAAHCRVLGCSLLASGFGVDLLRLRSRTSVPRGALWEANEPPLPESGPAPDSASPEPQLLAVSNPG